MKIWDFKINFQTWPKSNCLPQKVVSPLNLLRNFQRTISIILTAIDIPCNTYNCKSSKIMTTLFYSTCIFSHYVKVKKLHSVLLCGKWILLLRQQTALPVRCHNLIDKRKVYISFITLGNCIGTSLQHMTLQFY